MQAHEQRRAAGSADSIEHSSHLFLWMGLGGAVGLRGLCPWSRIRLSMNENLRGTVPADSQNYVKNPGCHQCRQAVPEWPCPIIGRARWLSRVKKLKWSNIHLQTRDIRAVPVS